MIDFGNIATLIGAISGLIVAICAVVTLAYLIRDKRREDAADPSEGTKKPRSLRVIAVLALLSFCISIIVCLWAAGILNRYSGLDEVDFFIAQIDVRNDDAEDKDEWGHTASGRIGDEFQVQLRFRNQKHWDVDGVMVRFKLPEGVEYVRGSTVLYNAKHPGGATISGDSAVEGGIDIGGYTQLSNAFVRIKVRVTQPVGDLQYAIWSTASNQQTVVSDEATLLITT